MPTPAAFALSQATNLGTSTSETTIVTADANARNNLAGLIFTSLDTAAASVVTLREDTAGATRALFDYPNAAAAPGPFVIMFDPPLLGLLNKPWTIQSSVNAIGTKVTALFVKG